jgi:hypothetical protein
VIEIAVTAYQVIYHQPGDWKNRDAYIKPGANDKGFVNDIFSNKIKNDPGKYGCQTIA